MTDGDLISVVIPIYNERENLPLLYDKLSTELPTLEHPFEVILVNDGSTNGSDQVLSEIADRDARFRVVFLRRNFGQTAAMMAGIDFAEGEIIVLMDGDQQKTTRPTSATSSTSSARATTWFPAGARTARMRHSAATCRATSPTA